MARPPKPNQPAGKGYDWAWDNNKKKWVRVVDANEGQGHGKPGAYAPPGFHDKGGGGSGGGGQGGGGSGPGGGGGGGAQSGSGGGNNKGKDNITGSVGGTVSWPDGGSAPPTEPPVTPPAPSAGAWYPGHPSGAPEGSTNIVQFPDGSWIWNNPDGTRTIVYPEGTVDEDGNPVGPVTLQPGQSVTNPDNVPEVTPPAEEEEETEEEVKANNDLLARMDELLGQFGLNTPGLMAFAREAISKGWGMSEFMLELRRHPDYLANPLFAANIERTKDGKRFMSEGEVLQYATDVKSLAKRFGYAEPSNAYIAEGFKSGKSIAEYEHHLTVQQRVKDYGAGVGLVYKQITGHDPTDQDLHELFDPETNTATIDRALRQAELRGRPFTLGLGIRTEAEARALEMLGVSPDEAFSRYQSVAQNASRFARYQSIEDSVLQGLPENFGQDLSTEENSLLMKAFLMPGTVEGTEAFSRLQDVLMREAARWKQRGGPSSQQGQLTGLLSQEQIASYG